MFIFQTPIQKSATTSGYGQLSNYNELTQEQRLIVACNIRKAIFNYGKPITVTTSSSDYDYSPPPKKYSKSEDKLTLNDMNGNSVESDVLLYQKTADKLKVNDLFRAVYYPYISAVRSVALTGSLEESHLAQLQSSDRDFVVLSANTLNTALSKFFFLDKNEPERIAKDFLIYAADWVHEQKDQNLLSSISINDFFDKVGAKFLHDIELLSDDDVARAKHNFFHTLASTIMVISASGEALAKKWKDTPASHITEEARFLNSINLLLVRKSFDKIREDYPGDIGAYQGYVFYALTQNELREPLAIARTSIELQTNVVVLDAVFFNDNHGITFTDDAKKRFEKYRTDAFALAEKNGMAKSDFLDKLKKERDKMEKMSSDFSSALPSGFVQSLTDVGMEKTLSTYDPKISMSEKKLQQLWMDFGDFKQRISMSGLLYKDKITKSDIKAITGKENFLTDENYTVYFPVSESLSECARLVAGIPIKENMDLFVASGEFESSDAKTWHYRNPDGTYTAKTTVDWTVKVDRKKSNEESPSVFRDTIVLAAQKSNPDAKAYPLSEDLDNGVYVVRVEQSAKFGSEQEADNYKPIIYLPTSLENADVKKEFVHGAYLEASHKPIPPPPPPPPPPSTFSLNVGMGITKTPKLPHEIQRTFTDISEGGQVPLGYSAYAVQGLGVANFLLFGDTLSAYGCVSQRHILSSDPTKLVSAYDTELRKDMYSSGKLSDIQNWMKSADKSLTAYGFMASSTGFSDAEIASLKALQNNQSADFTKNGFTFEVLRDGNGNYFVKLKSMTYDAAMSLYNNSKGANLGFSYWKGTNWYYNAIKADPLAAPYFDKNGEPINFTDSEEDFFKTLGGSVGFMKVIEIKLALAKFAYQTLPANIPESHTAFENINRLYIGNVKKDFDEAIPYQDAYHKLFANYEELSYLVAHVLSKRAGLFFEGSTGNFYFGAAYLPSYGGYNAQTHGRTDQPAPILMLHGVPMTINAENMPGVSAYAGLNYTLFKKDKESGELFIELGGTVFFPQSAQMFYSPTVLGDLAAIRLLVNGDGTPAHTAIDYTTHDKNNPNSFEYRFADLSSKMETLYTDLTKFESKGGDRSKWVRSLLDDILYRPDLDPDRNAASNGIASLLDPSNKNPIDNIYKHYYLDPNAPIYGPASYLAGGNEYAGPFDFVGLQALGQPGTPPFPLIYFKVTYRYKNEDLFKTGAKAQVDVSMYPLSYFAKPIAKAALAGGKSALYTGKTYQKTDANGNLVFDKDGKPVYTTDVIMNKDVLNAAVNESNLGPILPTTTAEANILYPVSFTHWLGADLGTSMYVNLFSSIPIEGGDFDWPEGEVYLNVKTPWGSVRNSIESYKLLDNGGALPTYHGSLQVDFTQIANDIFSTNLPFRLRGNADYIRVFTPSVLPDVEPIKPVSFILGAQLDVPLFTPPSTKPPAPPVGTNPYEWREFAEGGASSPKGNTPSAGANAAYSAKEQQNRILDSYADNLDTFALTYSQDDIKFLKDAREKGRYAPTSRPSFAIDANGDGKLEFYPIEEALQIVSSNKIAVEYKKTYDELYNMAKTKEDKDYLTNYYSRINKP